MDISISWHLNKKNLESNFKVKAVKMKVVVLRVVVDSVVWVWPVIRKVEKIMVGLDGDRGGLTKSKRQCRMNVKMFSCICRKWRH